MCRSEKNYIVRDRSRDFVTLVIDPDSDHATVVARGAELFHLNKEQCSLVHMNGSKVVDCKIVEGGQTYSWSIGRYMRRTYAKSSSFKLGMLQEDPDVEVYILIILIGQAGVILQLAHGSM